MLEPRTCHEWCSVRPKEANTASFWNDGDELTESNFLLANATLSDPKRLTQMRIVATIQILFVSQPRGIFTWCCKTRGILLPSLGV
jgi:hypothetical protein